MKTSLLTVAATAVVSSLVTLGVVELVRPRVSTPRAAEAVRPPVVETVVVREPEERVEAPTRPAAVSQPVAATEEGPAPWEERLDELEQRLARLELSRVTAREPLTRAEAPPQEDLRTMVLDWVAEEREARAQAAAVEGELDRQREMEFEAKHQALMLAKEHGLEPWQREEFEKLFLEMHLREEEIETSIDIRTDDPELVEARWEEFDRWIDQRERELTMRLDPELYQKIYGDEDE